MSFQWTLFWSLIFYFLKVFSAPLVYAKEVSVFEVRKNLQLKNDQATFKDYYINAGTLDGLQKGMLVNVYRDLPFKDESLSKTTENLKLDVATVKIIHAQQSFSVVRVHKNLLTEAAPVLEFQVIMLGDRVDLASKRMAASESKADQKKQEASAEPQEKIAGKEKAKAQEREPAKKQELMVQPDPQVQDPVEMKQIQ